MRLPLAVTAVILTAGCGGHSATPAGTPAPAARPAASAEPATLRYAPGTARYRYEQVQHATQEVMGQTTTIDATTMMIISAAFTPGDAGNINAAYTIDSVALTSATAGANALDALRGKTFHAVYTTQGMPVSYTPPDTSGVSALSGEIFREFVPRLPAASIAAGTTWTDTVNAPPTMAQGMTVHTQSIRTHHVVGWEPKDGGRALHIATSGTYTITGEGEQNGAPLTLAGNGVSQSDRFILAPGVFSSASARDSADVKVNVISMGLEIPVHQIRTTTLTRLP